MPADKTAKQLYGNTEAGKKQPKEKHAWKFRVADVKIIWYNKKSNANEREREGEGKRWFVKQRLKSWKGCAGEKAVWKCIIYRNRKN